MFSLKKNIVGFVALLATCQCANAEIMHPVSEGEAGRIMAQMQAKCKQNRSQIEQKMAEWNPGSIREAMGEGTSKRDALKEKLSGGKKSSVEAAIAKFYQDVTLKEQAATRLIQSYEKKPKAAPPKGGVKIMPDAPNITPDSQEGREAQQRAINGAREYGEFCDTETAKIIRMMS